MGNKSRPSFKKRQKEMARQQKQMDKRAQRQAKSEQRGNAPRPPGEEDPDLAGIRPGPQALPDEWNYVPPPPAKDSGEEY
ncbi:MAG TPA: hypothetical protein VFW45_13825 [Candidatus Polarisedimenticolia bacterium]|nr:hypothetical protein [Candidatus Polarisedimenticolia bacterium]